jgi:hypothetical protein
MAMWRVPRYRRNEPGRVKPPHLFEGGEDVEASGGGAEDLFLEVSEPDLDVRTLELGFDGVHLACGER